MPGDILIWLVLNGCHDNRTSYVERSTLYADNWNISNAHNGNCRLYLIDSNLGNFELGVDTGEAGADRRTRHNNIFKLSCLSYSCSGRHHSARGVVAALIGTAPTEFTVANL
jgi:hypothetical protein